MNKSIAEICLEIDNIIKKENIPFSVYKEIVNLLCEIVEKSKKEV